MEKENLTRDSTEEVRVDAKEVLIMQLIKSALLLLIINLAACGGNVDPSAPTPDGVNWTSRVAGTTTNLNAVSYGNGLFVAVGSVPNNQSSTATIFTSPDGATWTCFWSTNFDLSGIAYGNGHWVVVGGSTIMTSTNLTDWWVSPAGALGRVQFVKDQFIAVGAFGTILTSPDGITWANKSPANLNFSDPFSELDAVAFGNDKFVAVGQHGLIVDSPDGGTWTARTSNVPIGIMGIAYGKGQYVAVGTQGVIAVSGDGYNWTRQTSSTTNDLIYVSFSSGLFVAVGAQGTIVTSPDGSTWTTMASNSSSRLKGVTYGNGHILAVGDSGTILEN